MSQIKEKRGCWIGSAMNPPCAVAPFWWIENELCIAWHDKPQESPMLCWRCWPVTLQTLKDAQENNSRETTGVATDRVAMNCCEHKHQRAVELFINKIRLKSPPHLILLVFFILTRTWIRWMSEADILFCFRLIDCWTGVNKRMLHSYSLIPFQFCSFCCFSWCAVLSGGLRQKRPPKCPSPLTDPQPDASSTPFKDVGWLTHAHACTHVAIAHFI